MQRTRVPAIALLLSVLLLPSPVLASSDCECENGQPPVILPIGDSRVQGARPSYESYRYELWKLFVESGIDAEFVGTREDSAQYPEFRRRQFDPDHAGIGGDTTTDVLARLDGIINLYAEIVLIGIGGNDIIGGASAEDVAFRLDEIIVRVQQEQPWADIVVEQIAPAQTDAMPADREAALRAYNELIPQIAERRSRSDAPVIVVDMATGWRDEWLADAVHYNEAGAAEVAARYFQVIRDELGY